MPPAPHDPAVARRILVAEDEPHIRRILATLLQGADFEVDMASDGREAMARLESATEYHLVVTDLMMPHLSGLEVLEAMAALSHRTDLPVVMLTAKGQDADREKALALGARDFLTKPFSPKKLLARIDELLGL
ncbi:MAG: response regulator [Gemmatimonadales bacterium]|nr:MAG: response regulator [Gemmatimonadales bacterium]